MSCFTKKTVSTTGRLPQKTSSIENIKIYNSCIKRISIISWSFYDYMIWWNIILTYRRNKPWNCVVRLCRLLLIYIITKLIKNIFRPIGISFNTYNTTNTTLSTNTISWVSVGFHGQFFFNFKNWKKFLEIPLKQIRPHQWVVLKLCMSKTCENMHLLSHQLNFRNID